MTNVGIYSFKDGEMIFLDDGINQVQRLTAKIVTFSDIDGMYEMIKTKIIGELGCVCLCLSFFYENEERKEFVKLGLLHGFKKVEIIDEITAKFLCATLNSHYKPKQDDIIWAFDELNHCSIWRKRDAKIEHINYFQNEYESRLKLLENILRQTNLTPDIILYCKECNIRGLKLLKQMFPNSQIFACEFNELAGIIVMARILAGHTNMLEAEITPWFDKSLSIALGNKELFCLSSGTALPISRSVILRPCFNENIIYVYSNQFSPYVEECICVPSDEKLLLKFSVDRNRIYSFEFNVLTPTDDSGEKNKKNELTIKKERFYMPKTIGNRTMFQELYSSVEYIVGIDIGGMTCCTAVNRSNKMEVIALDNTGERLLPTYVSFDDEIVKCGKLVVNRLQQHFISTVFDIKEFIGKRFEDIKINKNWPFKILHKSNLSKNYLQFAVFPKNNTAIRVQQNKTEVLKRPEQILAVLLQHVKEKAEEYQSTELFEAVLTVPAAFTNSQNDAICVSALIAGWRKVHLLLQPIASIFAYSIEFPIKSDNTVLIFDLGGKTLNISICKVQNNEIQLFSHHDNPYLGGKDFDDILVNYFKHKIETLYGAVVPPNKHHKLLLKCCEIKESLSAVEKVWFAVEDIITDIEEFIEITRDVFEHLMVEVFDQIRIHIAYSLTNSGLINKDVNNVLYVGGGCRMPMVKKLLQDMFPYSIHYCSKHPDEINAIGAAYYASYLTLISREHCFLESQRSFEFPYKLFERRNSV